MMAVIQFVKLRIPLISRSYKLLLVALAGLSISIVAGYLLSRHRRRYRAVTSTSTDSLLRRKETFRATDSGNSYSSAYRHGLLHSYESSFPLSDEGDSDADMFEDSFDYPLTVPPLVPRSPSIGGSDSSGDSFHSTVESLDPFDDLTAVHPHNLYLLAMQQVEQGLVQCRTIRTRMLSCSGDDDFLAKLHCVRLAFDGLFRAGEKDYIKQAAQQAMVSFLRSVNEDPTLFSERFDDLTEFVEEEEGWRTAKKELTDRKVVCMNVFDVAMDFVLLDAFDDLDHPPSTVVAVLRNRWITDGMKKAALSAAVWSLLKAKRSLLQNKDGFMSRFYLLTETLTPVLAWGFLGTDDQLRQQCLLFRGRVMLFLKTVFSLDGVRYTTVNTLSDDILHLAQSTMEPLLTA